jgi:hypothetical protein
MQRFSRELVVLGDETLIVVARAFRYAHLSDLLILRDLKFTGIKTPENLRVDRIPLNQMAFEPSTINAYGANDSKIICN